MASDDDTDLDALRSAVLATLKTRNKQDASPPMNSGIRKPDSDLEQLRIAALHSSRPLEVPIPNIRNNCLGTNTGFSRGFGLKSKPYRSSNSLSQLYRSSNSLSQPYRSSNLIVIEPVKIEESHSLPPQPSVFLTRPQDRYCRTTEDEASQSPTSEKPKRSGKFSRFESDSDSDDDSADEDDDDFLKSDVTNNGETSSNVGSLTEESPTNGGSAEEDDEGAEETGDAADLVDVLLLHPTENIVEDDIETSANSESVDQAVNSDCDNRPHSHNSSQENSQRGTSVTNHHQTCRTFNSEASQDSGRSKLDVRHRGVSSGRFLPSSRGERMRQDGDGNYGVARRNDKNVFGDEITDTRRSSERQRDRRTERFGGRIVDASRRREDRNRDDCNVIRPRLGRTNLPGLDVPKNARRNGGDPQCRRRRLASPLPLTSANRNSNERYEPSRISPSSALRNASPEPLSLDHKTDRKAFSRKVRANRKDSVSRQSRPDQDRKGGGTEPLHDLREKLKSRNRVVEGSVDDQEQRSVPCQVTPNSPRDHGSKLERRNRSRSPIRRSLVSIVQLKPTPRSELRPSGVSPIRVGSVEAPSKRSRSSDYSEGNESQKPRKVLIVKDNHYSSEDILSKRHGINVTLTEVSDLPDSDSSVSNRLPIHLRLGHFAKSVTSVADIPQSKAQQNNHSTGERKGSGRRKKKSKCKQSQDKDDCSPPRHVQLKRDSFRQSAPSSSSLLVQSNGLPATKSQRQSGTTFESELDEKIRRIKENNDAIRKRQSEVEKEKRANY